MQIGDKLKFSTTSSDGSVITYSVTIRKIEKHTFWVEIPRRVMDLPFPPYDGKRYAQFSKSQFTNR